ncbi:MAG: hypothetical protein IJU33_05080 [Bacteroidales bacterium]|nr:hypothetical protein [Bacteroidales bacterium]
MNRIAENLKKIVGAGSAHTLVGKVVKGSVDGCYCDVQPVDGALLKKVRLNAFEDPDKGLLIVPEDDSYVIVTMLSETDAFVSMFSAIKDIVLNVSGNIKINGEKNGALITIQELTDALNNLVAWCEKHTHTGSFEGFIGGSPASGTLTTDAPANGPDRFNSGDYENDKITH